jgi:hypothetical protein
LCDPQRPKLIIQSKNTNEEVSREFDLVYFANGIIWKIAVSGLVAEKAFSGVPSMSSMTGYFNSMGLLDDNKPLKPEAKIAIGGIIPSSRVPNNGVPLNSPPASSSLNHSGVLSPSNNPKLRTLRSLLPFGPGKAPITNANGSNASKGTFLNFGNVRRSMTGEPMNSFSRPRPEEDSGPPVISIHPSNCQNLTFKPYMGSQPRLFFLVLFSPPFTPRS